MARGGDRCVTFSSVLLMFPQSGAVLWIYSPLDGRSVMSRRRWGSCSRACIAGPGLHRSRAEDPRPARWSSQLRSRLSSSESRSWRTRSRSCAPPPAAVEEVVPPKAEVTLVAELAIDKIAEAARVEDDDLSTDPRGDTAGGGTGSVAPSIINGTTTPETPGQFTINGNGQITITWTTPNPPQHPRRWYSNTGTDGNTHVGPDGTVTNSSARSFHSGSDGNDAGKSGYSRAASPTARALVPTR